MASLKCSGWKRLFSKQIWTNTPKLNKKKKRQIFNGGQYSRFQRGGAILVVQNHLSFKNWEIIPLWFSPSEISQLCLKWGVIHWAGNGGELRLHSANCKTAKCCCAAHPGASFAKHFTTWRPSKVANQGCSGKKKNHLRNFLNYDLAHLCWPVGVNPSFLLSLCWPQVAEQCSHPLWPVITVFVKLLNIKKKPKHESC